MLSRQKTALADFINTIGTELTLAEILRSDVKQTSTQPCCTAEFDLWATFCSGKLEER
jgi:hypothetical protein